jgi:hypothetical protein
MSCIAIEWSSADRPALFHASASPGESRLLLRGQNAAPGNWNEARYRLTLAGDDIFLAGLNFADAAGKRLVSLAQGYRSAHIQTTGLIIQLYVAR